MQPIHIYLVRHGQTYFNRYNRMQGWSDSPLTELGRAQAVKAGQLLHQVQFDHAYSSDTTRAMNTAKTILAEHQDTTIPYTIMPSFRETSYGYFEGADSAQTWFEVGAPYGAKNFAMIVAKYGLDKSKDMMNAIDPFHDAETADQYWKRLDHGFELIAQAHPEGGAIMIVSHGTTIRSIVERYGAGQYDVTVSPANAGVTQLLFDDQGIQVLTFNETETVTLR